jgi:hypothetical protein
MNQWRSVLSPAEVEVLYYINERTTRYDKEVEKIPLKHFIEGVYTREGIRIIAGLNRNKSTIIKAYQQLQEKGLIVVKKVGAIVKRNTFAINFKKLIEGAYEMAGSLKVGKKYKESQQVTQRNSGGSLRGTQGVTQRNPIKYTDVVSTGKTQDTDSRLQRDDNSLAENIDKAINRQQGKMREKASKAETNFTAQNVLALWKEKMIVHHGRAVVPSVTRKDFAVLRNNFHANSLPIPLPEFFDWAIANWSLLKDNELKWVKDMPLLPSLRTFGNLYQYFVRAYGEFHLRTKNETARLLKVGSSNRADKRRADDSDAKVRELTHALQKEQRERGHYQRIAAEKRPAYTPKRGETKNHEDLGFDDIEPL